MSSSTRRKSARTASQATQPASSARRRSPSIEFVGMRRVALAPFNDPQADFVIQTQRTNTMFRVSLAILAQASSFFRQVESQRKQNPGLRDYEHLDVAESDATIETILRFIYPVADPVVQDLDDVCDAYQASVQYKFDYVAKRLREFMLSPRFMDNEPVRVYAIARRFGLAEETNIAARHVLRFPPNWPAYEEFDHISGRAYHELLTLHKNRGRKLVEFLHSFHLKEKITCMKCCPREATAALPRRQPEWWQIYVQQATPLLLDSPANEDIFSLEFILKVAIEAGITCSMCCTSIMQAAQPGGAIAILKEGLASKPFDLVVSM
ncbi:unnamed protein product [Somion occarium]|uniref:BTB domain-containing protein n=2 Tax=Somion occarium TaxID=3059160 RepID=A0ABP1DKN7_9APHY